jgi:hypothetical protein
MKTAPKLERRRTMSESLTRIGAVEFVSTVGLFLLFGGLIGASAYVAFIPAKFRINLKVAMVLISLCGWLVLSRVGHLSNNDRWQHFTGCSCPGSGRL